jgi:amino acid adenylation domain-containing protein
MLGILKADCIHIPVDPSGPAARVAKIIASAEPRVILASSSTGRLLGELTGDGKRSKPLLGWMESESLPESRPAFTLADLRNVPAYPLEHRNHSADPAHILFTSGSTGTPKGVVITHANVIAFVNWAVKYFGLGPADRMSGHPPLHFDLSTFDVFGAFAAGAQLHLVPPELNLLPTALAELIRRSQLTQWFSVPSLLSYMAKFDVVRPGDFPSLRRVLWCGEVFPTPALRYWMQRVPHATFTNLYGPTETTIASSYHRVERCPDDDRAAIPIGTACDGEELLVLNDAMEPVPAEESGNIYIGGAGVSPGYWRDPQKTRAAFVLNPSASSRGGCLYRTGDLGMIGPDGLVYFLGRADSQIKSRGYRIELGEIESALNALTCLRECAVVAVPSAGFEGTTICCAYVPAAETTVTPAALRQELGKVLPAPMLPARWKTFERLPRNANGKFDRRELQEAFASHETVSA